jgi:hypothetical protein
MSQHFSAIAGLQYGVPLLLQDILYTPSDRRTLFTNEEDRHGATFVP